MNCLLEVAEVEIASISVVVEAVTCSEPLVVGVAIESSSVAVGAVMHFLPEAVEAVTLSNSGGGRGNDSLRALSGAGRDKLVQKGGRGADLLRAFGGRGRDKIIQKGGRGRDELWQGVVAVETSLSSVVAEVRTFSEPLVAEGGTKSTRRVAVAVMFLPTAARATTRSR